MKYYILIIAICISMGTSAQTDGDSLVDSVVTNSFWDNWYGQVSGSLLNSEGDLK